MVGAETGRSMRFTRWPFTRKFDWLYICTRTLPLRTLKPVTLTSTAGLVVPGVQAAASGPMAACADAPGATRASAAAAKGRKSFEVTTTLLEARRRRFVPR